MDNIKDIVPRVIKEICDQKFNSQDKIFRVWHNILNKQETAHTKLAGIKNGHLMIHVDSPGWLYQMNFRKSKILECLKEDGLDIKGIHLKIGKIE